MKSAREAQAHWMMRARNLRHCRITVSLDIGRDGIVIEAQLAEQQEVAI